MATSTISFKEIYSKFMTKVEANDLFSDEVSSEFREELLCSYVHSAISSIYIRRIFETFSIVDPTTILNEDEELIEVDGKILYQMKKPVNEELDRDYVLEVVAYGMAIAYVEQRVNSTTNLRQLIGTADERFYSQNNFLSGLENLRDNLMIHQQRLICERGGELNDYLDGILPLRRKKKN